MAGVQNWKNIRELINPPKEPRWQFVVCKQGKIYQDNRLCKILPPEEQLISIDFSNGERCGTYVSFGRVLQLTIEQQRLNPELGPDYVWDVIPNAGAMNQPKFMIVAAPGVQISSGVFCNVPIDLDKHPDAIGLDVDSLFYHPQNAGLQKPIPNYATALPAIYLAPDLDIIRVQDRDLLPRFDERIRPEKALTGWNVKGGIRVQPQADGISIFSKYASGVDTKNPLEFRIKVAPESPDEAFSYKIYPRENPNSHMLEKETVAVVSTINVSCEILNGYDHGFDTFGGAQDSTIKNIDDIPSVQNIAKPVWKQDYWGRAFYETPYKIIYDGPDAVKTFWPVFKFGADIGIGMIPIAGDVIDIADFVGAVISGKDKWGDKVGTLELALMGLGALLPIVGSGVVRRVGGSVAGSAMDAAAIGSELAMRQADQVLTLTKNLNVKLYNEMSRQGIDIKKLLEKTGCEPYLQAILNLKPSDLEPIVRAANDIYDELSGVKYVKRLEAGLPPKGKAPDVKLPRNPATYFEIFKRILDGMRSSHPPAGSLDDLLSQVGEGFRVPYLQNLYRKYLENAGINPLSPKAWLRDTTLGAGAQRYVRDWMGPKAARVEFGNPELVGEKALDDYFDAILDEASEGRTGLGRAFDYDRFPVLENSAIKKWPDWQPGYPIDMPIDGKKVGEPNGWFRPTYADASERGRLNIAFFEVRTRLQLIDDVTLSTGEVISAKSLRNISSEDFLRILKDKKMKKAMKPLDKFPDAKLVGQPFWRADMPYKELVKGAEGRSMRKNANGGRIEFEHFKPQRAYQAFGLMLGASDYRKLDEFSGWTNPNNLVPMPQLRHMEVDAMAAKFANDAALRDVYLFQGGKKALESVHLDKRVMRPLSGWTNIQLQKVADLIRRNGRVPKRQGDQVKAQDMLDALRLEVAHRKMHIHIPRVADLVR